MHKFEQAAVLLTLTRRYNVNKMNKNLEKCINNFSFNKATLCWLSVDFLMFNVLQSGFVLSKIAILHVFKWFMNGATSCNYSAENNYCIITHQNVKRSSINFYGLHFNDLNIQTIQTMSWEFCLWYFLWILKLLNFSEFFLVCVVVDQKFSTVSQ